MKSLKEIYKLEYDTSGFNSSLIQWYNITIDKPYDKLDVIDVSRMIRQNILKDVAFNKAFDLLNSNPYCGEYRDGELLDTIVSQDLSINNNSLKRKMGKLLGQLELDYIKYDWVDEDDKKLFFKNMQNLKAQLAKD